MYLRFRAVRILGVVEGAIPGTPREDPLLPDAARAWLEGRMREGHSPTCLVERSSDRGLRETHRVFLACVAARERLALSAPRRWLDDTDRALSGLVLEAAVALGRPDPDTGTAEVVPSLRTLRRLYVGQGTAIRRAADEDLLAACRLVLRSVATSGGVRVPPAWVSPPDGVVSLGRLRAIAAARASHDLGTADGALGDAAAWLRVPGLSVERGISASALATLLACPHRYLLERLLHLGAPGGRPSTREIAPLEYGSLVHRVLEDFFRRDGKRFCKRNATLEEWTHRARDLADRYLDEFLGEYALVDAATIDAQRARLYRDVGDQLRAAWRDGVPSEFVGVEVIFGQPRALRLAVGGGRTLWVQGRIDRLERTAGGLVLRDVKTGKCKVGEDSSLDLDLQIALYHLVAPALVPGAAVESAGYVYSVRAGDAERLFAGEDLRQLEAESREWLGLAAEMLDSRLFPHAPDPKRCEHCDFEPACGADAAGTAGMKLAAAPAGSLARRIAAHYLGEEGAGD
jgi:RecB family exonuclease